MTRSLPRVKKLLLRTCAAVTAVLILKFVIHVSGYEFISLNPLFSGIVAANVFLMSFLLSGVLVDYKESERLPGELAANLEAIAEEALLIFQAKQAQVARECAEEVLVVAETLQDWFYKKARTVTLLEHVSRVGRCIAALESLTQATFLARLKNEQGNIRRLVTRIHAVRETSFVASGYLLADATTALLLIGLVLAKIDPFTESMFFVGVITFLLTFLAQMIRDLDNPFGYYENNSVEDVSLKPLADAAERIRGQLDTQGHE